MTAHCGFLLVPRISHRRGLWVLAFCILAAALSLAAGGARAGEVSGTVTLDGAPVADATVDVSKADGGAAIAVRTDGRGRYRVFLEPGHYDARLPGAGGSVRVRSFPAPVRQDLRFGR